MMLVAPLYTRFPYTTLFRSPVQAEPRGDVVADGHGREGIGTLEDHSDDPADRHRVDAVAVDVLPVEDHRALHPGAGDQLVQAVDRKSTRLNSSHANISYAVF